MLHIAFTLLPTIALESGVLLLLTEKRKKVLWASVVINTLTNVPLNLYVSHVDSRFSTILWLEVLIVAVECAGYELLVRRWSQALTYSLLCNATSFFTGLVVQLLFVMLI